MKKIFVFALAFGLMSCTEDYTMELVEEVEAKQTIEEPKPSEEYTTMYNYLEAWYQSELFNMANPAGQTYDELMSVAAEIIMTDTFADTFGEGECKDLYLLMLDYFEGIDPDSELVEFLKLVLLNEYDMCFFEIEED